MNFTVRLCRNNVVPTLKTQNRTCFDKLEQKLTVRQGETLSFNTRKRIETTNPATIGFVIINQYKNFISKSDPRIENNYKLLENFVSQKINELRQIKNNSDTDFLPVIYGGIASDSERPFAQESCRIVDHLEEACRIEGIEPLIISGQYDNVNETPINSYIHDKGISLWGNAIDQIFSNKSNNNIFNNIKNLFEYVNIPKSLPEENFKCREQWYNFDNN